LFFHHASATGRGDFFWEQTHEEVPDYFCRRERARSGASQAADPAYCAQYAYLAVHEAQVLSTLACFKGFDNTWHLDYQRHYGWCLTAPIPAVDAQRDYRRMRIAQCQGH
jgi:hypothetical protein